MASAPVFAVTPKIGVAAVSTANTNFDGTGTVPTIFTAGANGSKIDEVRIQATVDPADSMLNLFLHDGTNFWYFDSIDLGNPATGSTTVEPYSTSITYENLVLPTGWSLRASVTVALTTGVLNVFAFASDL